MKPFELELTFIKSTKGTHVYGELREDATIPSVYIKKPALPSSPPPILKVVISADD